MTFCNMENDGTGLEQVEFAAFLGRDLTKGTFNLSAAIEPQLTDAAASTCYASVQLP
jgi:hypothetical protein